MTDRLTLDVRSRRVMMSGHVTACHKITIYSQDWFAYVCEVCLRL